MDIGDRVKCLVNNPDNNQDLHIGSLGTVCRINGLVVGVRWDNKIAGGHSCSDSCDYGYGWNILEHEIELFTEEETEDIDNSSFMRIIGGIA